MYSIPEHEKCGYIRLARSVKKEAWMLWWRKVDKKNDEDGDGFLGFVHQAVIDQYLSKHPEPEEIEFYFCGPPLMNKAVTKMCDDWGVPEENVSFDDFGG